MKTFLMMLLALLTLSAEAQPWPPRGPRPRDHRDYRDPRGPRGPYRPQPQLVEIDLGTVMATDYYQGQFVNIDSCRYLSRSGRIHAIKLVAFGDDVHVANVDVQYAQNNHEYYYGYPGEVEPIYGVEGYLQQGYGTQWADLSGRGRCIDNIRIVAKDRNDPTIDIRIGGRRGGGHIRIGDNRQGYIQIKGLVIR